MTPMMPLNTYPGQFCDFSRKFWRKSRSLPITSIKSNKSWWSFHAIKSCMYLMPNRLNCWFFLLQFLQNKICVETGFQNPQGMFKKKIKQNLLRSIKIAEILYSLWKCPYLFGHFTIMQHVHFTGNNHLTNSQFRCLLIFMMLFYLH